jgi:D-alanine-D-alanine ligase
MVIGFAYNLKPIKVDFSDPRAELWADFDTLQTIEAIEKAIKNNGFEVIKIEADEDAFEKLRKNRDKIDLVFNFSVAVTNTADREAQIPMFCEILQIPYTGPGPLAAASILNKARAKEIWRFHGVPTAKFQMFFTGREKLNHELRYPLIVKANEEGSSAGVRNDSVVRNRKELDKQVKIIMEKFGAPVLVEKFLSGREFTVAVLGNGENLEVLPIIEANFKSLPKGSNHIDSYEAKWIWDDPKMTESSMICPAKIRPSLRVKIEEIVKKAFRVIGCRDWARLDLRMDNNGKIQVLEINCPVGLLPKKEDMSKLPTAARAAGLDYDELVCKIIRIGLKRYKKIK